MSRSRKIKFVFLLFIIISAILAAVIVLIPFLVSTDAIRIRLARDLSTWTGYNVQLRGPPHISIFPSFRASLSGVTLTDEATSRAPLMDARRIDVDLSLYDALLGRVRFSETRIINPRFTIDEPVKTVGGFFTSLSHSEGTLGVAIREAQALVARNPENPDPSQLLAQPFGRILVKGGTLVYPATANETDEITDINAAIDWPESTRSVAFRASGYWHGALTDVTIKADQALLLMAGGTGPLRVSINAKKGGITFTGSARFAQDFLMNGRIAARSPGWNQSMDWIGRSKLFGADITSPVVWESTLSAQSGHVELNDIVFTLGNDDARGALEIALQNKTPVTTGSLAFESLDLDQIVPALFPDGRLSADLSFLDRFGLDLRLSTSRARLHAISMSNLAASIQIRNGGLMFDIGNAQIFGGTAQTNIQLRRDGKAGTAMEGRLSAGSVSLEQLRKAPGAKFIPDANASLLLNLKSTFTQWDEFVHNAQGDLSFELGPGSLANINGDDFIRRIRAAETFLFATADNASFKFDRIDGKAQIRNGQINLDSATLRSGRQSIDIRGNMNWTEKTLKLTGALDRPRIVDGMCIDTYCLAQALLPITQFSIDGPWEKPAVSPLTP